MFIMEQEKLTKITFFTGYNYHLRYFNIKRKIKNLDINAEMLQEIINEEYKPLIFEGGEISKNGQKIFDIKKIQAHFKSKGPKQNQNYSYLKKTIKSIPYTEEAKYYLMVEIISETTQYCADLASILIGLKDFGTKKSTFSQIKDARIKKWYLDYKTPSMDDFLNIFNFPQLSKLTPEERFAINLKFEELNWSLIKIGKYYSYNYDYLYTPYRHGMKGSFWREGADNIFCRTLTKDKRYNLFHLSKNRIDECLEIADLIYFIFHNDLQKILFSKGLSPLFKNFRLKLPKAPEIPNQSFNPKDIKEKLPYLRDLKLNCFNSNDIGSIHEFCKNSENNINFQYVKPKNGVPHFKLDCIQYFLDEFYSFSKKIKEKEYIIISISPLALFIELLYISLRNNSRYNLMFELIGDSIFNYLVVEKNLDFVFNDLSKTINRAKQFKGITDEIVEDFIILIGLNYYKDIIEGIQISDKEISYLIYIYKCKITRRINRINFMKKSCPDIILNTLVQILIVGCLTEYNHLQQFAKELKINNLDDFLRKCYDYISNSIKNELEIDFLLELVNFLYETTNFLDKF